MNNTPSLSDWIAHLFDHPVAEEVWDFTEGVPEWEGSPELTVTSIAETFERSGELLARYSDAQLGQGLWCLISAGCSALMLLLADPGVPLALRIRALRSFVPLFEQVMAVRCLPLLSHLDEQPANELNTVCYMWWDVMPIHSKPSDPDRAAFDAEVLEVLRRILDIPHDACRESALHGVSEWWLDYRHVEQVVDDWLARTPDLRPALTQYANLAKIGCVQ